MMASAGNQIILHNTFGQNIIFILSVHISINRADFFFFFSYSTPVHISDFMLSCTVSDMNMCTYINKCIHSKLFNYWSLSEVLNQPLVQHAAGNLHISFAYQSNTAHDTCSWIIHRRYIYIRYRAKPLPEAFTGTGATSGWDLFCGWLLHQALCPLGPPRKLIS